MAENVGLICGAITGQIYAVINPDDDSELDNPRWLLIQVQTDQREPVLLLRVALADYMACTHPDEVQAIAMTALRIAQ